MTRQSLRARVARALDEALVRLRGCSLDNDLDRAAVRAELLATLEALGLVPHDTTTSTTRRR